MTRGMTKIHLLYFQLDFSTAGLFSGNVPSAVAMLPTRTAKVSFTRYLTFSGRSAPLSDEQSPKI